MASMRTQTDSLRQFMPKGTNLNDTSRIRLNNDAALTLKRTRKSLGWKTPAKAKTEEMATFDEAVALAIQTRPFLSLRGVVVVRHCRVAHCGCEFTVRNWTDSKKITGCVQIIAIAGQAGSREAAGKVLMPKTIKTTMVARLPLWSVGQGRKAGRSTPPSGRPGSCSARRWGHCPGLHAFR